MIKDFEYVKRTTKLVDEAVAENVIKVRLFNGEKNSNTDVSEERQTRQHNSWVIYPQQFGSNIVINWQRKFIYLFIWTLFIVDNH